MSGSAPTSAPSSRNYWIAGAGIVALAASVEFAMGRKLWGISGEPGFWAGDIWSSHNSQWVFDPYSFSHLIHGMLSYGVLWLVASRLPVRTRAIITLAVEAAWEMVENSGPMIHRYREITISLNYYGDSVVNSMSDIMTCMAGFLIAYRLPARVTIAAAIILEIGMILWIRDGLILNILMLIHPIPAIREWQLTH
ncbi:MAG TPA: DUF2585 family protein [Candidatus Binataceae bacterium]|nr:DUF2585 family protein [Candidatus Binataceae bacterium]